MSQFCVLGLRIWSCKSGHVKIAPTPIKPLFPINGNDEFGSSFFEDNPNLIGNKPQTALVAYRLKDSNSHSIYSNNKAIIEYFWDKGHQYYNTNNEGEDDETIQKESEPDSYNKKYNN
ncbi:7087_t:CDS:2 [Entrophospora sp. SA101]|nr:7087_t:CDS:2 [Entrophospora sp. SA101]